MASGILYFWKLKTSLQVYGIAFGDRVFRGNVKLAGVINTRIPLILPCVIIWT